MAKTKYLVSVSNGRYRPVYPATAGTRFGGGPMPDRDAALATDHAPLLAALDCAVPLRMLELARMTDAQRERHMQEWAANAATALASRGDQLMFRTPPRKGEGGTADTFNHLAAGLAAAAYLPGGVTFAGRHWCTDHAACQAAAAQAGGRHET